MTVGARTGRMSPTRAAGWQNGTATLLPPLIPARFTARVDPITRCCRASYGTGCMDRCTRAALCTARSTPTVRRKTISWPRRTLAESHARRSSIGPSYTAKTPKATVLPRRVHEASEKSLTRWQQRANDSRIWPAFFFQARGSGSALLAAM